MTNLSLDPLRNNAKRQPSHIRLKTMTTRTKTTTGLNVSSSKDRLRLDESRVEEILDVATAHFIAHGFEGASITEISREANASKTTLYARFPNKDDLFLAVLERRIDVLFGQVTMTLPIDPPLEQTLKEYGLHYLQMAISKDQVALLRVVSMECKRFPKLGRRFYERGPKRGLEYISQFMREQIKRKRLVDEDPELMAEHLSSLLTGGPLRWAMVGLGTDPDEMTQRQRVDAAVKIFLRAYGNPR